ncbi:MAG: DUF1080 domain-containing protein [Pirellulales bacterium]|nr:DUF1080 domain-containing protein [Pirellulales bacterium]
MKRPLFLTALLSMLFAPFSAIADGPAVVKTASAVSGQAADEAGFVHLFNGRDFDGWQGALKSFEIKDGILASKTRGGGFLYTKEPYGDFVFRFEYKLHPGSNNGIGIRVPLGKRPTFAGMEIQLLDDSAKRYAHIDPSQYNGSIYGVIPCKRGHLKPVGEWNTMEIRAEGHKIRVTLNGTVVTEGDVSTVGPKKIHRRDAEGLHNLRGHLCLCAHNCPVEFRNLRIKEL